MIYIFKGHDFSTNIPDGYPGMINFRYDLYTPYICNKCKILIAISDNLFVHVNKLYCWKFITGEVLSCDEMIIRKIIK